MKKLRVGVIFGGRSGEHEVSLLSARAVLSALDPKKYEVVPLAITKTGHWMIEHKALELLGLRGYPVSLIPFDLELRPEPSKNPKLDVVFPVLHGTYGEDGTMQGFLELAGIPYVGAGVLGSAVAMDKGMMRTLLKAAGLPLMPWITLKKRDYQEDREKAEEQVEEELGYPCFVKPANLGSSVGISKVKNRADLQRALGIAGEFDRKMVVEKAAKNPREIECSVLGNHKPRVSVLGEIIPGNEFYDYKAKYVQDNSELIVPVALPKEMVALFQDYARRAFLALDCTGMARVDFFLTEEGEILVNEVNTIPGFTPISMYPKLWEASGLSFSGLVDELLALALENHAEKQSLRTHY